MSMILTRSIPLGKETRDAWRSAGVSIVRRSKLNNRDIRSIIERSSIRGIINLGNLNINFDGIDIPVFNRPDSIRAVSTPIALRETLEDFIPARNLKAPHWHKRGGFKGEGKWFHKKLLGECALAGGDVQEHIDGEEFRVNTVGDVIVQAHRKEHDGNPLEGFDWSWCGIDGIRSNGIIPLIKRATPNIPNWSHTVFGWDIIVGDMGPKVIEINTSAGVNAPTAERIVRQIERVI